jgi:SET domain-containing protein
MVDPFELKLTKERLAEKGSPIEGMGMFARLGFRAGDLLSVMQGRRVAVPELKRLYDDGALRPSDPLQVSERHYLVMEPPFLYINHSCDPNTAIVGQSNLVALYVQYKTEKKLPLTME